MTAIITADDYPSKLELGAHEELTVPHFDWRPLRASDSNFSYFSAGNHAICSANGFFFTSLPAGNLRQFAHQITQLLYCPWYLLMGITIRLKNFWHLWGGLYIGQEQLRPRVVIRADSGLLSAVVLFKKTNINSKRWNSGNYHTAWKKGRCNETNYEE